MLNKAPKKEEFLKGIAEFRQYEKRDAMYKVATFLISYFWGKPSDMADGLGVLLLTWNQAFYRYGIFDFELLEDFLATYFNRLEEFRERDILSLTKEDEDIVKNLFKNLLDALQISSGKSKGKKSPVAVSKALHLLAPKYFPLWDDKIARAYGCYYSDNPSEKYMIFCRIIKWIAKETNDYVKESDKSIIKLIDEYNYAKFTKMWI